MPTAETVFPSLPDAPELHEFGNMSQQEAISYHYDNDTEFFALWLDETLTYSSGRWLSPPGQEVTQKSLQDAQRDKLRFHLDAAGVQQGSRVLDVGCGWGSILFAAAGRGASAHGLTLSSDQLAHVESKQQPGVTIELADVFELPLEPASYDAVISIGAFEHFAKPAMDRAQKVETYSVFFERMHAALAPGGTVSLQTIVWDNITFDEAKRWIPETVFPQSDIPFIDEVIEALGLKFRLAYMENSPQDYALTLSAWIEGLRAHRATIEERWGSEHYKFFERYLRHSRAAFMRHKNSLARFVLVRR